MNPPTEKKQWFREPKYFVPIIVAIIGGVFTISKCNSDKPTSVTSINSSPIVGPVNTGSGNQYITNDNRTFKDTLKHLKSKSSTQTKGTIDAKQNIVVTSSHQSGGITTGILNLSVPEDKDMPISDNIVRTRISKNLIEFKPIQGTWKIPYIEIPANEVDSVKPVWYFNRNGGARIESYSYPIYTIGNKQIRFIRITIDGPAASPNVPYFLQFKKTPSIYSVGDQSDTTKTYSYEFK